MLSKKKHVMLNFMQNKLYHNRRITSIHVFLISVVKDVKLLITSHFYMVQGYHLDLFH